VKSKSYETFLYNVFHIPFRIQQLIRTYSNYAMLAAMSICLVRVDTA